MYGYFKDIILPKKLIAIEDLIDKLFNKNGAYCTKYFISSQRRKLSILNIKLTKAIEEYFNNKNGEPFPDRRKIIISRNGYCIEK